MVSVPYSPVPSTTPSTVPLPSIRVNAPEAAFGGEVAQGLSHLGTAVEGAGNELFARAYALQQLNNESDARDADAQYMIEAGKLHAQFNALEGKARVDAYDGYAKNLQDLRVKIRGSLSNPMAQKMYDASSLSTMSRTIFNGAGAAASAGIQYNKGTLVGQINLDAKTVEDNPNDEALFQEKVQRVKESTAQLAGMEGFDPTNPKTADMQAKTISHLALQRIIGMARNQPYQASKLFEDYKAKGLLYGDDVTTAEGRVQGFAQTVGAATISDQVLAAHHKTDGTYDASFEDMQAEAKKQATDMYPNDPKMGVAAAAAFDRNYNQVKFAKAQDQAEVKQQVNEYITKGVTDPNLLPPDLVKRMTPEQIKQFPAQANAYQHSISVQTNQVQYDKLLGMYNNDNASFMNTDLFKVPGLSKANIDFFLRLQRQANANGDPRVSRAMGFLKGAVPQALDDLGVTGPRLNRDVHNQFVGALHSAIQGWQEEYSKPPSEKDIVETIYPSLLRQVAEPGWLWGTNQTEFFKSQLPQPIVEQATKAAGHELSVPELEQVRNEYMRTQFNQFYKTSKGKFNERFSP